MQIFDDHIFRNDPGFEDHDDDQENHDRCFANQVLPREYISGNRREEYAQARTDDGDEQGIYECPADYRITEHNLEIDEREAFRYYVIAMQRMHFIRM
jgi:hypothetical protein